MCTFICTVCQNRIKEYGTQVDCGWYDDTREMIEDTTKLYDKSFLCPAFIHVKYREVKTCRKKKLFKYKYDALKTAFNMFENHKKVLRPYKCKECSGWHLTSGCNDNYNPVEEFNKAHDAGRLYD